MPALLLLRAQRNQIGHAADMNTDLKHYISFTLAQGLKILFSMLGMAVLARYLGPEGLGRWTMIVAAGTLLHVLLINWIQQDPLMRFGKEEWIQSGKIVNSWNARMPFIGAGVLLSGLLLVADPGRWTERYFHLSPAGTLLAFCFFLSVLVTIEFQTLLQITGQMIRLAFAPVWVAAASLVLYASVGFVGITSDRVETILAGVIGITLAVWIAAGASEVQRARIRLAAWDRRLIGSMLAFAWPLLPAMVLNYVVNWGNQVLIQRSFSSQEVGLYQSAFQVHGLMVMQAVPFTIIILPRIIGKHLEDPGIMKRYVHSITPTLFCLWLLAMIPAVAVLPFFFTLVFGHSFQGGIPVLTTLLAATPICALGQMYTVLYAIQNKMGRILLIMMLMASINLAGTLWVMPHYGIRSAAAAFGLAFVTSQFLTYFYQHRSLHVSTVKMNALLVVLALFSVGQLMIQNVGLRLVWAGIASAGLILTARWVLAADRGVLDRLFTGRLRPLYEITNSLFIGPKSAVG